VSGIVHGVVVAAVLALAGCGSSSPTPASGVTGDITVFAAASLTETFTRLGEDFEAAHPGTKVKFNFAGSSALAQQLNRGAPADVFASAAPANMKQVTDTGTITDTPTTFARNQLTIAVPKGNPGRSPDCRTSRWRTRRSPCARSRCRAARRRRRCSRQPG